MKRILLLLVMAAIAVVDISAQHEVRITTKDGTTEIPLDEISRISVSNDPWGSWAPIKGHEDGTFNFSLYVSGSYPIGKVLYREHMIDRTRAQFLLQLTAIGANEDMIVDYNKETHQCQVGVHYFLDNNNYGPVFVSDIPHYPLQPGIPYDNYPCSFDPETGVMSLNLIYFVSTGLGSSASGRFAHGVETMQLSGYKQYDYGVFADNVITFPAEAPAMRFEGGRKLSICNNAKRVLRTVEVKKSKSIPAGIKSTEGFDPTIIEE